MKVKELIDYVNNAKFYCPDDVMDSLPYVLNKTLKYVTEFGFSEHRWYVTATQIFKCDDGFVGIAGPVIIKSEEMSWKDTGCECVASEYVKVMKPTYEPKQD